MKREYVVGIESRVKGELRSVPRADFDRVVSVMRIGSRRGQGLASLLCLSLFGVSESGAAAVRHVDEAWSIENRAILVTVFPDPGRIEVMDKRASYTWNQPASASKRTFTDIEQTKHGISFTTQFKDDASNVFSATVTLSVPSSKPELHVMVDADPSQDISSFDLLEPFVYQGESGYLAMADWCDGHIYPTDIDPWPGYRLDAFRIDFLLIPWVGVFDLSSGLGYSVTVETAHDAELRCIKFGERRAPMIRWLAEHGKFGYPRKIIYTFAPKGGYVTLAKAYRDHADDQGLVVPLSEKAKRNPNIRKLYGAFLLWDYFHHIDAVEAKTLGVERALHYVSQWGHFYNRTKGDSLEAVRLENELGWLTEEYVQFNDAYPITPEHPLAAPKWDRPETFAEWADGSPVLGWKDRNGQMTMRCSEFFKQRAREYMPGRLVAHPLNAYYVDVVTQREMQECRDPEHPKTRREYREDAVELLKYVRNLGLVLHGECTKWFFVPYQDVALGVASVLTNQPWSGEQPMTYGQTEYSAGTVDPETWNKYEEWGSLGHRYRIPLFELVFHDCIVSTQRESDAADFCCQAEDLPFSYQRKKDALAVLYGSMPSSYHIIVPRSAGAWTWNRPAFMTTYRNVCKPLEVLCAQEMLDHRYLTPDRDVQMTRWSDGTEVICNFGSKPFEAQARGKKHLLPQFGFVISGPRIESYLVVEDGKEVTRIIMAGYRFDDSQGVAVAMGRIDRHTLRVNADYPGEGTISFTVRPREVAPRWNLERTVAWKCDPKTGERTGTIPWAPGGDDGIRVGPFDDWTVLELELEKSSGAHGRPPLHVGDWRFSRTSPVGKSTRLRSQRFCQRP